MLARLVMYCERRAELAQHLISEASRLAPGVQYHFEQGLHSIDFDRQAARVQAADGSTSEVGVALSMLEVGPTLSMLGAGAALSMPEVGSALDMLEVGAALSMREPSSRSPCSHIMPLPVASRSQGKLRG